MTRRRRLTDPRVLIGLLLLLVAFAVVATRVSFFQGTVPAGERNERAPEFKGIAAWLNSPPLTVAGLRGKVVLVDFWAYSCVNCVRTFPSHRLLYERYRAAGLEIVGVHSPEFAFEKLTSNVREAIDRHDLPWPVALDNDMNTWRAYRNHYWPHVYVIDARGRIRFDHIGEGGEERIQDQVRTLLTEAGVTALPEPIDFTEPSFTPHLTPEIYAGALRGAPSGAIGNPEGFRPGTAFDYRAVPQAVIDDAGTDGTFFLEGRWRATDEFLEASEDGARLVLSLYARDVFFVGASSGTPVGVRLVADGRAPPEAVLGRDASGGVVRVSRSDLYRLLTFPAAGTHRLELIAEKGFRLFTFTFG